MDMSIQEFFEMISLWFETFIEMIKLTLIPRVHF